MIATPRLLLRRHEPDDVADVLATLLDPETRRWNPAPDVTDLDSAKAWCDNIADWTDGTHASFAIVGLTSGRYLGSVSVHSIKADQAESEIGYRVAPWARGRGYATEAVRAAAAWAFENLELVRMELAHAVANRASCAVAAKAGFRLEGMLRQSFVYGDGVRYDEHLHARLRVDTVP